MTDDELLALVTEASDAFESYALRHFNIWRRTPEHGGERELLVTIKDRGPDAGPGRYSVEVQNAQDTGEENPPYSLSNPEPTVELALDGVHWNEFDKPIDG